MPNTDEISNYLFKRSLQVGNTNLNAEFFSEPLASVVPIYPEQIWSQKNLIPSTAPVLAADAIDVSGTIQYKEKLSLVQQPSGDSFYNAGLINAIPFNYDPNGSYNYVLYKNDGTTIIPFSVGDWVVDNAAGILTFYGTKPSGLPPKISFYKYVGTFGISSVDATDSNGVTNISQGSAGTDPINKGESSDGDRLYIRKDNGVVLLGGANPPGGLSDVAPLGIIDNSANEVTIVRKVVTINLSNIVIESFPSNILNQQSYSIVATAHGTTTAGAAIGKTITKKIESTFCYPDLPSSIYTEIGNIEGGDLEININGNFYELSITGINTYNITWIVRITYSQYRLS